MEKFYIGAATAAHQVEGNNKNCDIWALEQMKYGGYPEKSGIAADHYNRYKEDIQYLKEAGLNAYRFSLEWARIEPEEGKYDMHEVEHYRNVMQYCVDQGIEPFVTLHHFSSPVWLIRKGGWESETTIDDFARYTRFVCEQFRPYLHYICTMNEVNIGVLIGIFIRQAMKHHQDTHLQIGVDIDAMAKQEQAKKDENISVFGVEDPAVFVAPRTPHGVDIIKRTHQLAVEIIHEMIPDAKVGLTLSLRDVQYIDGGKELADQEWEEEFGQFASAAVHDDFIGVQNYTRTIFDANGEMAPEEGKELTQMQYEYYPEGLAHVVRRVYEATGKDICVTENGIATLDDSRRVAFIQTALHDINQCRKDGIPVKAYMYWSLLDNYEWQSGYTHNFGLIRVDRNTMQRTPNESLYVLGKYAEKD